MQKEKIQALLGFWLIVSPWVLGFSAIILLTWSNIIVGTAIFLINLWQLYGQSETKP